MTLSEMLKQYPGHWVNASEIQRTADRIQVTGLSILSAATTLDIAFFLSRAFEKQLSSTQAGILVTSMPMIPLLQPLEIWKSTAIVVFQDAYGVLAQLTAQFAQRLSTVAHLPASTVEPVAPPWIHPSAEVHPSAHLQNGVQIGAFCVVEREAQIGQHTVLYPGCYVGPFCQIGEQCVLFSQVVLYEGTQLGQRVRLHSHSVLGADGFGYAPQYQGKEIVGHQKIYHLGHVVVGSDVEVGAGSCIDRGTLGDTWIGHQVKIDNHVHIGHNVRIDQGAVLCGKVAVAGHAHIGKFVYVGGLVGISNHVHIGDGAKICAGTLLSKSVSAGEVVAGNPQKSYREHFQAHALLSKMLSKRRKKL